MTTPIETTLVLDDELRAKIYRRAEQAFKAFDEALPDEKPKHITRCWNVQKDRLRYRVSHSIAGTSGPYSGPKIVVERIITRRWYPPWTLKTKIIVPNVVTAKVEDTE